MQSMSGNGPVKYLQGSQGNEMQVRRWAGMSGDCRAGGVTEMGVRTKKKSEGIWWTAQGWRVWDVRGKYCIWPLRSVQQMGKGTETECNEEGLEGECVAGSRTEMDNVRILMQSVLDRKSRLPNTILICE